MIKQIYKSLILVSILFAMIVSSTAFAYAENATSTATVCDRSRAWSKGSTTFEIREYDQLTKKTTIYTRERIGVEIKTSGVTVKNIFTQPVKYGLTSETKKGANAVSLKKTSVESYKCLRDGNSGYGKYWYTTIPVRVKMPAYYKYYGWGKDAGGVIGFTTGNGSFKVDFPNYMYNFMSYLNNDPAKDEDKVFKTFAPATEDHNVDLTLSANIGMYGVRTHVDDDTGVIYRYTGSKLILIISRPVTKVLFDGNGGKPSQESIQGNAGTSFDASSVTAAKTGYKFTGWDKANKGTFGLENTTYKATWSPNVFNVMFDANGGSGKVPSKISVKYGVKKSVPGGEELKMADMCFRGWSLKKDGSGKLYEEGDDISKISTKDDVTLYAVYTKKSAQTNITNVKADYKIEFGDKFTLKNVSVVPAEKGKKIIIQKYNKKNDKWVRVKSQTAKGNDTTFTFKLPRNITSGQYRVYTTAANDSTVGIKRFTMNVSMPKEKISVYKLTKLDKVKSGKKKIQRYIRGIITKDHKKHSYFKIKLKKGYPQKITLYQDGDPIKTYKVKSKKHGKKLKIALPSDWDDKRERGYKLVSEIKTDSGTIKDSLKFKLHVTDQAEQVVNYAYSVCPGSYKGTNHRRIVSRFNSIGVPHQRLGIVVPPNHYCAATVSVCGYYGGQFSKNSRNFPMNYNVGLMRNKAAHKFMSRSYSKTQPGDICVMQGHVGIVVESHKSYVMTIEGNTSGHQIMKKKRNGGFVRGFITPSYRKISGKMVISKAVLDYKLKSYEKI